MATLEGQFPHLFGAQRAPQPAARPVPLPTPSARQCRPKPFPMRPVIEVAGSLVALVPIGDLARAMNRSVGHVRCLEAKGVLPPPGRRRRVAGHRGWRLYDERFVMAVASIAAEERISSRRAVMDMTSFSERVWAAHAALQATAS